MFSERVAASQRLAEEVIEVVVGADPDPSDGVAVAFSNRAVLLVDTEGDDVVVAGKFFEPERWVVGVFREELIRNAGGLTCGG